MPDPTSWPTFAACTCALFASGLWSPKFSGCPPGHLPPHRHLPTPCFPTGCHSQPRTRPPLRPRLSLPCPIQPCPPPKTDHPRPSCRHSAVSHASRVPSLPGHCLHRLSPSLALPSRIALRTSRAPPLLAYRHFPPCSGHSPQPSSPHSRLLPLPPPAQLAASSRRLPLNCLFSFANVSAKVASPV